MGSTLRDLGSTLGKVNQEVQEEGKEEAFAPEGIELENDLAPETEEQEDEDVIDIDNPEDLARRGLRRIQIEGEDEEYLLDTQNNIYDLVGNFIGTTEDGAQIGG